MVFRLPRLTFRQCLLGINKCKFPGPTPTTESTTLWVRPVLSVWTSPPGDANTQAPTENHRWRVYKSRQIQEAAGELTGTTLWRNRTWKFSTGRWIKQVTVSEKGAWRRGVHRERSPASWHRRGSGGERVGKNFQEVGGDQRTKSHALLQVFCVVASLPQ